MRDEQKVKHKKVHFENGKNFEKQIESRNAIHLWRY